jgi:hypothetical protein
VVGSTANGRSATLQHQKVGRPPQSRGGGCRAHRQDHNIGGSAPLPTLGGGVPLLAACVRDARSFRFACHARSAISQAAPPARPKIATLIPLVFGRAPLLHRGKQAAAARGISHSSNVIPLNGDGDQQPARRKTHRGRRTRYGASKRNERSRRLVPAPAKKDPPFVAPCRASACGAELSFGGRPMFWPRP